ncbi:MAG: hypothetical protein ABI895_37765 [Deltaproteobacteria bacterium]
MWTKRAQRRTTRARSLETWLALPFVFACGDSSSFAWVGTQECSVGIPPEQAKSVVIPPVSLQLDSQLTSTGSGFYLRNFTLGPIAGFSCAAVPLQVSAHYTERDVTQSPGARPVLARALELEPFECRATDGRTYTLTGTGQADLRSAFFNMTFSAWLSAGQATLTCTTRFVQVASDAGVPAAPEPPQSFEPTEGEGTEPTEGEGTEPPAQDTPEAPPDPAQ